MSDAEDAARWRWIREQHCTSPTDQWFIYGAFAETPEELDAEIDKLRLPQSPSTEPQHDLSSRTQETPK
jgi:hypothetical protein